MPEVEIVKMTNLLKQLRRDILSIEESRNARLFKGAGADLQQVYKLHLTNKKPFKEVEYYLKNLYKSYNFAAAMISEAVKKKVPVTEHAKLEECLEVMINIIDRIISKLNKIR